MVIWGYQLITPTPVPDFSAEPDVDSKKAAFFDYLKPHIQELNAQIAADRARLIQYSAAGPGLFDHIHLRRLQLAYLSEEQRSHGSYEELLKRVDEIPISLALVQAAKESGWGASRFAQEGFNFFGQQCFHRGCGFTPRNRAAGRQHEVARFKSARDAVRSYVHNLNTHPRYQAFRELRANSRQAGEALSGTTLALGLQGYSERGSAYVEEVQSMIQANQLE